MTKKITPKKGYSRTVWDDYVDDLMRIGNLELIPNFKVREFWCKCGFCGYMVPMHSSLLNCLQTLRKSLDSPIKITSGFRCVNHNKNVGGSPTSFHTVGAAVDVFSTKLHRLDSFRSIHNAGFTGIGISKNFIHLDVRAVFDVPESVWIYRPDGSRSKPEDSVSVRLAELLNPNRAVTAFTVPAYKTFSDILSEVGYEPTKFDIG